MRGGHQEAGGGLQARAAMLAGLAALPRLEPHAAAGA